MLNISDLKDHLRVISQDFSISPSPAELEELIPAMLENIGNIDSELRDELIYPTFSNWILQSKVLDPEKRREILTIALDEKHLFYRIGESGTDSVFTRSFSVLLLPLLMIAHRETPYLQGDDIRQLKESLLRFARMEKDRRGYVPGPGWAHAVAHCADALDDLAQCSEHGASELREILDVLKPMIIEKEFTYGFGEDERMVTPVIAILRRQLLQISEIENWIDDLGETALSEKVYPQKLIIQCNVMNFLKSLYFRVKWAEASPELLPAIELALKKVNRYAGN